MIKRGNEGYCNISRNKEELWNQRWTCGMFVCFSYPVVSDVFTEFIFKLNLHLYLPFCFSPWHQCWILAQKLGGSLNPETKSKNNLGKEIIAYQLFFPPICLNRLDYFNKFWMWWKHFRIILSCESPLTVFES